MVNDLIKTVCKVCNGKGGWRRETHNWREDNWTDCLYCDGFGFIEIEKDSQREPAFLLRYNTYRKMIIDVMETFGMVISVQTMNEARTVEINFIPRDTVVFKNFAEALMRFASFNSIMDVELMQVYNYDPTLDEFKKHIRIVLNPTELSDLDGFMDFIRAWEKTRRGMRK